MTGTGKAAVMEGRGLVLRPFSDRVTARVAEEH